jgi:hypothetical protein
MMPAKLLSGAIAMLADPGAKASHLREQRISIETRKVLVQVVCSHPRILLPGRDHGKSSTLGMRRRAAEHGSGVQPVDHRDGVILN